MDIHILSNIVKFCLMWSDIDLYCVVFNERKLVLGTPDVKVKVKVKVKPPKSFGTIIQ